MNSSKFKQIQENSVKFFHSHIHWTRRTLELVFKIFFLQIFLIWRKIFLKSKLPLMRAVTINFVETLISRFSSGYMQSGSHIYLNFFSASKPFTLYFRDYRLTYRQTDELTERPSLSDAWTHPNSDTSHALFSFL